MYQDWKKNRLKENKQLAGKVEELKVLEQLVPVNWRVKKEKQRMMDNLNLAQRQLEQEFNDRLTELELNHIKVMIDFLRRESGTISITENEDEKD